MMTLNPIDDFSRPRRRRVLKEIPDYTKCPKCGRAGQPYPHGVRLCADGHAWKERNRKPINRKLAEKAGLVNK